jgi:hypothetical protein
MLLIFQSTISAGGGCAFGAENRQLTILG